MQNNRPKSTKSNATYKRRGTRWHTWRTEQPVRHTHTRAHQQTFDCSMLLTWTCYRPMALFGRAVPPTVKPATIRQSHRNFYPVPPPGELDQTHGRLWFCPTGAIICKHNVIRNTGSIHKVLHRQRKTEPRPQLTCTENFVKFGHVVFEICERTDRQTYRHADHNTSHPSRRQSNEYNP